MQNLKTGFFMISREKSCLIGMSAVRRGVYDILVENANIHTHIVEMSMNRLAKELEVDDMTLKRILAE